METMAADYDHFAGGLLLLCVIRSNIRHGSIITVGRIGSSLRVGVGVRPIVAAHLAIGTRCDKTGGGGGEARYAGRLGRAIS